MNSRLTFTMTSLCLTLSHPAIQAQTHLTTQVVICPGKFHLDQKNFFLSEDPPGWKTYKALPKGTSLAAENFGGAAYSPEHARIACFYQTSNKKWVALISTQAYAVNQADLIDMAVWKFNSQNKIFVCGAPEETRQNCQFKVSVKK